MNRSTKKLVLSALLLAVALLLPSLFTGGNQELGMVLSPMHIPVLIAGFTIGAPYAAAVGALTPVLRSLLFGAPPFIPLALAMLFEMSVYGLAAGFFFTLSGKRLNNLYCRTYLTLACAMLAGRLVFGMAMALLLMSNGAVYSMEAFISAAFIRAFPGIVLHILLIPLIIIALVKARMIPLR